MIGRADAAREQLAAMQHLREDDGSVLDRSGLRRRRALAGRADDVDRRHGDPGGRCPVAHDPRQRTVPRRGPASLRLEGGRRMPAAL
ncbi:hypothetical protein ACHMWU_15505 [Aeromicrobium sp. UC242_57]